jgi:hypothetical protein
MDLNELFTILREQGITEVTFKIGQVKPENPNYYRYKNRKQQVVSVEEKPDLTPVQDAPAVTEPEVQVAPTHQHQRTDDQITKFRNRYPDYKPELTDVKEQKNAKTATKLKCTKVDKAARVDEFKKENPDYFTVAEMAEACNVGEMLIYRAITKQTSVKKVGKVNYYKLDDVYNNRLKFERDIVMHDGSRQGNSKFIADKLLELLK